MNRRLKKILLIYVALMPFFSWACRPSGMEHEVRFSQDSVTLDSKAAEAIAQWFLYARDRLQVFEIGLFGSAPVGDEMAIARFQARAGTVERLIQSMNTHQAKIVKAVQEKEVRADSLDFDVIFIESQPGCIKTNTCCPQPLKK